MDNPSSVNSDPSTMNKPKWLWWILAIILIAGVGYGAYYLVKKQNTSDNNQTSATTKILILQPLPHKSQQLRH